MSIPGSVTPLFNSGGVAAAGGYEIQRSVRLNSADSAYFSRTPASSGNRKTWTWAGWVKRSRPGNIDHVINGVGGGSPSYSLLYIYSSDTLDFDGGGAGSFSTTQVFRDPSAWYHIVLAFDTTQATSSNRIKLWVNGQQVTAFNSISYPTQNADGGLNQAGLHKIGNWASEYSNFYLADIHFIDGQALTPSSFTEVSATTGQLIPKAYTGTFTGNSFWLKFSDNSSTTSGSNVGIGKDFSGLGNYWNSTNLSVTAGAGNDSLVDTPTSYGTDTGVGGEVRGNYATLNPLSKASVTTLSNGNLDASMTGSSYPHLGADSTIQIPVSGKWYWEITPTTVGELWLGVRNVVDGKQSTYYRDSTGGFNNIKIEASSSTGSSSVASYTNNDVISVALNADSLTIAWYKNGSQVGSNYSLTTVQNLVPYVGHASVNGSAVCVANFGQRPFAYTAPSGFKALCDTNLPAPVVAKPSTVMDVALWTGNSTNGRAITGLAFQPDFVWIKRRSASYSNLLFDAVRGFGGTGWTKQLVSDSTAAEDTGTTNTISSFDTGGFTLGTDGGVNFSGSTYVAWTWDAGTSTVTNTQGSISGGSQVRANPSSGFSVVTWVGDGTGTTRTVGHGLGVAPSLIIAKNRTSVDGWPVYHKDLGNSQIVYLNTTAAASTNTAVWNSTSPTSTVFSIGGTGLVNELNYNYVAYCFAPVAGYSSFGSYTGNGSADGTFIYTGFRLRWLLIKNSSSNAGWSWQVWDTARSTYNTAVDFLRPDLSNAEVNNTYAIDFTSNGFKLRNADGAINGNGNTYIYAAFAENPFQYARAR